MAALKRGAGTWRQAARKGEAAGGAPKTHPGGAAAVADFVPGLARDAGMQPWHVRGWLRWAKQNQTLVVLRTCNKAGLPRHFDELVTGKTVDVKWKTATSGPHEGLVVVPHATGNAHPALLQEILKLRRLGYRFTPAGKNGVPEPGALLIGPDGRAFCSDVDKMGIYAVNHGRATPHPAWAASNDNPALRQRLQKEVYGGGPEMDHHGAQDFWVVGVDGRGHPIMGRHPQPNETFLVIHPDGTSGVVNLTKLKAIYHSYGIRWPYHV